MSEARHTPGPWTLSDDYDTVFGGPPDDRGSVMVANIAGDADDPENEANARLIAAAPELLEVARQYAATLEALIRQSPTDDARKVNKERLAAVQSTIAKATAD